MPKINSRTKGATGEREFCQYLFDVFKIEQKPERNLEQVRSGGADIICDPFAFEIKRCENVKHNDWWQQVREAVKNPKGPAFGLIPVVAYRQNSRPWEFLIAGTYIGVDFGFVHITEFVFIDWARQQIAMRQKFLEQNKSNLNIDILNAPFNLNNYVERSTQIIGD